MTRDRRELADELRDRAQELRLVDPAPAPGPRWEGRVLQDIPNGVGHVLRLLWREPPNGPPNLSIRVWRESDRDLLLPLSFGVEVPYFRLPRVGEGVAEALDLSCRHVLEYRRTRPGR